MSRGLSASGRRRHSALGRLAEVWVCGREGQANSKDRARISRVF